MSLHLDDYSSLESLLRKAGFVLVLDDEEESNILEREQSLFLRDFEKLIDESLADTLCQNVKTLCRDETNFRKMLMPTLFKKNESSVALHQDSLIRLLLKINYLRESIIGFLLDEITKTASEDESIETAGRLRLLLNPLRFLPYISTSDKLGNKLIDILDIAPIGMQLEILDALPDILPDNCYHLAAEQLMHYLNSNENLTAAVLDCLSSLNLDAKHRSQIQETILDKILPGSPKLLPMVLDFLLSDSRASNVFVMQKIRDSLESTFVSKRNQEKQLANVLVLNKLKIFIRTRKQFADNCLSIINCIKQAGDHKPIDLVLLCVVYHAVQTKKRQIDLMFRKRVKDGLFKTDLLRKVFDYIPAEIFRELFPSFLEIAGNLIKSSEDVLVQEFALDLFKLLFENKDTDTLFRLEIVDNLISVAVSNDNMHIGLALNVIDALVKTNFEKVQPHTVLIMKLLEKVDEYDLKAVKEIYEILGTLTCGEDNALSGLKDELHMITRKQLSSAKKAIKFRGIIAAVIMARHIATVTQSSFEMSDENCSISDMPQGGAAREAASLLDLANASVAGCHECIGLFYDQLSIMISLSDRMDPYFTSWLYGTILSGFNKTFVTKTVTEEIGGLRLVPKYGSSEVEEVFVNIGPCTLKPEICDPSSILLLPSHFRLLRMLNMYKYDKDVSQLEYLFNAAIILPDVDDFDELNFEQLRAVANCLFHSINWLRELISGFILKKKQRIDCIKRLDQLIELEELLQKCLTYIPDYSLPRSYFDSLSQNVPTSKESVQKPAKRLKSKEIVHNDTIGCTANTQKTQTKRNTNKTFTEFEIKFREIDTDIIALLKYSLRPDEPKSINLNQLKFILKDFVKKLNVIITGQKTGLSHINMIRTEDIVKDFCTILPQMKRNLDYVNEKLKPPIADNENDESIRKTVFGLILKSFSSLFGWPGFQTTKNLELLRNVLTSFQDTSKPISSVSRLINDLVGQLCNYMDQCTHISQAVDLIKLIKSLNGISLNQPNYEKLQEITKHLLSKKWYDHKGSLDSGKQFSADIHYLVNVYLESSKVSDLNEMTSLLIDQVGNLTTKNDCLDMLPSITKTNFHVLYQSICNALHRAVKTEVQSLTNMQHLDLWLKTVMTMMNLMQISKTIETKNILSSFLKKSIAILKVFLSHGMPIFEIMLRSHSEKVIEILRKMQSNTRFLHYLCCYSKVTKDTGLVPLVPHFKLTLETLIYRVKGLLVANNCTEAFWMGNLKNRNLQGDDILTQSSTSSTMADDVSSQLTDRQMSDDDEIMDSDNEVQNDDTDQESEVYD